MNQTLLQVRKELKERKPVFIRQDNPKRMKLNYKWRKPKGIHSKIRHKFKGRRKMPSPGYKSPIEVKGLHSTGLKILNVHSVDEITKLNPKTEGAVIANSVGTKKRLEILRKAKELDVKVLNLNADEYIKKIEDFLSLKKKGKKETKKEEKKEAKEKKSKEQKQEALSDEDKKESNASELVRTRSQFDEKIERDRILTKKV